MIIDRERVKTTFAEYTSGYNATDPKIKLKIDHTYRVAELCELIARDLKLDEYETDVAWLTGMMHDVGRFEQIKRYNTFNDAQSVDHANFGADLLFKEGLIDTYVDGFHDDKYGTIVENAIRNHSAFRIDERLDDYTVMFCNILRDADKVDIFRVNVDTPAGEAYNVTNMDTAVSIKAMDELVCETIGSGKIKTVIDIPEDLASFGYNPEMIIRLDSKKLMQLGWKATIGLEEMFERLIKGMKK